MDQSPLVRLLERFADLGHEVHHARGRQWSESADEAVEVEPLEQLHDVVERAVVRNAKVVQLDGVRGAERGGRPGLELEPPDHRARLLRAHAQDRLRPDELDGRLACQQLVRRLPHLTHAALAKAFDQPVAPEFAGTRHVGTQGDHDSSARIREHHADEIREDVEQEEGLRREDVQQAGLMQ